MKKVIVLLLVFTPGCKHLQKKDKSPLLVPPTAEVKEDKVNKSVSLTLIKIDSLTLKLW